MLFKLSGEENVMKDGINKDLPAKKGKIHSFALLIMGKNNGNNIVKVS